VPEGTIAGSELFVYEETGGVGACSSFICTPLIVSGAPTVESASLVGPSGPVALRWVDGSTPEVGSYLSGAVLIPVKPLAANASYSAAVSLAPYDGLPGVTHRWTFTTGPPNPSGEWPSNSHAHAAGPAGARVIRSLRVAPRSFRVGGRHRGARVSYIASGRGVTRFLVEQLRSGVRSKKRCEAARARAPRLRRCQHYALAYVFSHRDRAGSNSFRLSGVNGRHTLARGGYRLLASTSPNSVAVPFTIIG
jgi:hypothetical protein